MTRHHYFPTTGRIVVTSGLDDVFPSSLEHYSSVKLSPSGLMKLGLPWYDKGVEKETPEEDAKHKLCYMFLSLV